MVRETKTVSTQASCQGEAGELTLQLQKNPARYDYYSHKNIANNKQPPEDRVLYQATRT